MIRFLLLSAALAGCGPSTPEPSADAEACEHLQEGPNVAVTATAAATGAPSVGTEHTRFDVTLIDVTGGKGGSVSFASEHEADHVVFLSEEVVLKVKDGAGAEVALESSAASSADCALVKGRHVVDLGVGTYTFSFGPTTKTSVQLVIEVDEAAHEH